MSDSYLDGKVREALLAAKGSRSLAQSTLMVWAMKDERLLQIMAQPFLKAITGAAIVAAIKRGVTVPGLGGPPPKAPPKLTKDDLARVLNQLGSGDASAGGSGRSGSGSTLSPADILGGAGGKPAAPSAGKPAAPTRRPGSATAPAKPAQPADQASTLRTLAAVYARNRKRS